jgi:hypothetical protein
MIRSLATVMCFGALAGAAVFWAAVTWSQHPLVVWIGERHQGGKAFPAGELAMCTAMGSLAADVDWAPLDLDFAAGKKALAAEDWTAAIAALKLAAVREPDNADVQNYIGYAYRRLRQMEQAFAHLNKAVALKPRHRSAHQHLGEAFLLNGEISKAEEHLAALERICLIPCEEYRDLKRAIAERRVRHLTCSDLLRRDDDGQRRRDCIQADRWCDPTDSTGWDPNSGNQIGNGWGDVSPSC